MKKTIFLALFWNCLLNLYPQCNDLNCVFFIDSKLVKYVNVKVFFYNKDFKDSVDFNYDLYTLYTNIDDFEKIKLLPDSTILQMEINYFEVDKEYHVTNYCFSDKISKKHFLKMKIINVITFDKMKKIFFIYIKGDGYESMLKYRKEFGNKRKFLKKINNIY